MVNEKTKRKMFGCQVVLRRCTKMFSDPVFRTRVDHSCENPPSPEPYNASNQWRMLVILFSCFLWWEVLETHRNSRCGYRYVSAGRRPIKEWGSSFIWKLEINTSCGLSVERLWWSFDRALIQFTLSQSALTGKQHWARNLSLTKYYPSRKRRRSNYKALIVQAENISIIFELSCRCYCYTEAQRDPKCTVEWLKSSNSTEEALCYKPESRGFDSRWGHWIFQLI
jgi:hypothetical protein